MPYYVRVWRLFSVTVAAEQATQRCGGGTQANSVWQLFNYAEWLAECKGRWLLKLNLDETAVCLHPGAGKGAVFLSKKRLREEPGRRQHVPFPKRRCYVSCVSVICDRTDVQPLPQFIIANERTFLQRDFDALVRGAPPNVTLIRQRSAWNTILVTVRIVRALSGWLRTQRAQLSNVQLLLILDAAKIHLHPQVLRACKAAGIWLLVVPPRMTLLIQPLDFAVFALFKAALINAYLAARLASTDGRGDIGVHEWLRCIYAAIAEVVVRRPWAAAFDHCGFGAQQGFLSRRVRETLQVDGDLDLPSQPPPDEVVRLCFPRRYAVDLPLYWSLFEDVTPERPMLRRATPIGEATPASVRAIVPWRAPRTRAEHRDAAAAAEAVAALVRVEHAPGDAPPRPLLRRYPRASPLDAD